MGPPTGAVLGTGFEDLETGPDKVSRDPWYWARPDGKIAVNSAGALRARRPSLRVAMQMNGLVKALGVQTDDAFLA